ncbi:lipid II:glycine glycyltransferase FemX [Brevibacterium oceani]|uniref:lipid II:glycine glycyltransferase FemX n=1 Tax=Brevibacterium oceani TaxID=358099 RepID=UPI001B32B9BD|nr:peptidoglycan bridge formation glycyltransferase FemA/FemB family protein [Brevibacterium oceani]
MTTIRAMTADAFLASLQRFDDVSYQQTPYWAEARLADWPEYEAVGWFNDSLTPFAVAIIRYRRIPGTTRRFGFIPYGPVTDWGHVDISSLLSALRSYLEDKNVIGVRMIPYLALHRWDSRTVRTGFLDDAVNRFSDLAPDYTNPAAMRLRSILRDSGWVEKNIPEEEQMDHAQLIFRLDLGGRTEEDVLGRMHKTWRYNAKKAGREGLEVEMVSNSESNLYEFHRLWSDTGTRNGFTTRSPEFLRSMWNHLGRGLASGFTTHFARLDGKALGASITARVTSTARCIYTATDTSLPKVKPSNAIYLSIIRQLIDEGVKTYDLGAVRDCLCLDDQASGLVRFKAETGADAYEYAGEWELPISPLAYAAFSRAIPAYSAVRTRANGLIDSASRLRRRIPVAANRS